MTPDPDNGYTVRFEPIEGDVENVRMIETFDLTNPRCPLIFNPFGLRPHHFEGALEVTKMNVVPACFAASQE